MSLRGALPMLLFPLLAFGAGPVRVLVVVGGHAHDASYYAAFEGVPEIRATVADHSLALNKWKLTEHFDVLVMHDMYDAISQEARENLRAFVEAGRGVVSTHHSIVDYTDWPWWHEEVTGGKYYIKPHPVHGASQGEPNVELIVSPVAEHPVTRGVGTLKLQDEAYRKMWFSPRIRILMTTDNPKNDRPVVYVGPHEKARVVYIQVGHTRSTHLDPGYQRLIRNAILWTARRD